MTILLVNDDGYQSEGIRVLEQVLREHGHEVYVCAPERERSSSSHKMTVGRKITAVRYGENHFFIDGYPSDCVTYSMRGNLFPKAPDVILSGINHGYNLSSDTIYSGTIGAASEGALMGIPSIALSCSRRGGKTFAFRLAAEFAVSHLDAFRALCVNGSFLSINVPPDSDGRWEPSTLGMLDYNDMVSVERLDSQERDAVTIELDWAHSVMEKEDEKSDFFHATRGIISVSVIKILPALDEEGQEKLKRLRASEKGEPSLDERTRRH